MYERPKIFQKKTVVSYDDPITAHPFWPKAVERAGKLSQGQANAWFLAVAAGLMRQEEQWPTSVDPEADLEEMLLGVVCAAAIIRDRKRRLAYNRGH